MVCTTMTIGTIEKKYDCINGICVESAGGQYTEPTCAGACKPAGDNTGLYILGAAALLGAYFLFGGKK